MKNILISMLLLATLCGCAHEPTAAVPDHKIAADYKAVDGVLYADGVEFSNPDNQHLKLDIARPETGNGPFPAVVCIHGGGFRAGDRHGYDGMVKEFAKRGYVAITIDYRLAPKYQFPAQVHDSKAAVRFLRAHAQELNIDPNRIGAMGGSAGAHLAQFLGVTAGVPEFEGEGNLNQSSAVAAVVSMAGPTDFTKSYGKSVDAAEVLPLFLGGNVQQEPRRHILSSPLYWVTPNAAPTLLVHGTADEYVNYEQAQWIQDRLKAAMVQVDLLTIEGGKHGLKPDEGKKANAAMFGFFDGKLKAASKP